MNVSARHLAALSALFAFGLGSANGTVWAACAPKQFDSAKFTVCTFDPAHDDIRLFLSGPDAKPYGSLAALAAALKAKGERLMFAMNAGMFKQDRSPVGLYVEDRRKLHEADTRGGASNFHMKPNGVFWIGDKAAGVTETSRYLATAPPARLRDSIRADADRRGQDTEDQAGRDLGEDPQRRRRMRWGRGRLRHRR